MAWAILHGSSLTRWLWNNVPLRAHYIIYNIYINGMHDVVELVGQHAMKKGLHPIRVLYFDHNGGDLRLKVEDKHGKEVKVRYWH